MLSILQPKQSAFFTFLVSTQTILNTSFLNNPVQCWHFLSLKVGGWGWWCLGCAKRPFRPIFPTKINADQHILWHTGGSGSDSRRGSSRLQQVEVEVVQRGVISLVPPSFISRGGILIRSSADPNSASFMVLINLIFIIIFILYNNLVMPCNFFWMHSWKK